MAVADPAPSWHVFYTETLKALNKNLRDVIQIQREQTDVLRAQNKATNEQTNVLRDLVGVLKDNRDVGRQLKDELSLLRAELKLGRQRTAKAADGDEPMIRKVARRGT